MGTVPTPGTATAGLPALASVANTWRDSSLWMLTNRPLFIGRSSANQSVATGGSVQVALDLEDVDKDGGHDNVTNNSRYTGKTAGYYVASAWINWQALAGTVRQLEIKFNGATSLALSSTTGNTTLATHLSCSTEAVFLNGTTDYIEIQVFQNSVGALNVAAGARFCVRWVETA